MRHLSFLIILLLLVGLTSAQSPHGDALEIDCSDCHESTSWKILPEKISFDHSTTGFSLIGQHKSVDCRSCHSSLVFSEAKADCFSCHIDIHQGTTGFDCAKCHTSESWIVKDINFIHQQSRFPLVGVHQAADCNSCHTEFHSLNFQPLGIDCYDCHKSDYDATAAPNHKTAGFAVTCEDCHSITSQGWRQTNIDHNFFPLVQGHAIANCFSCHEIGSNFQGLTQECYSCHRSDYETVLDPNHIAAEFPTTCESCHSIAGWSPASFDHNLTLFALTGAHINVNCNSCHSSGYINTPMDCFSCHQTDYTSATNPNHLAANFPNTCISCHTTTAWAPATFEHDALYFPIYSGKHRNEWDACAVCHTNPNNFAVFSCITCHEHNQNDMDDEHSGVAGYVYQSEACLSCHPDGSKANAFNHQLSNFPLTGSHLTVNCGQCHTSGYVGTPTLCVDCHQTNYNSSSNPNHQQLGISTDCASCHTSNPGWQPATFAQHDQFYTLTGSHISIANNCVSCHNGNYTTTSDQCVGCHQSVFNLDHQNAGLSNLCEQCHNTTAWIPSSFNHALTGFELTGTHLQLMCSGCHEGTTTGLSSLCISCHQENYNTAPNHLSQNYPTTCELCHNAVAWNQTSFNHQQTNFPLSGAHLSTSCIDCHETGYTGTSTICNDCHNSDYTQASNPSHTALALSTDCLTCHTTNPNWQPAAFPVHNNFYQLIGAHAAISNNCVTCHNGNYTNTPNTCYGCHQPEFLATTDPPHQILNFSHECLSCHNQNNWNQGTFNHNFYPISNDHNNVSCAQCHSQPNYQPQCLSCHMEDFLDEHDLGDPTNCWDCHSTFDWNADGIGKVKRFDAK